MIVNIKLLHKQSKKGGQSNTNNINNI